MRISRAAFDLIVREEVSSEAAYRKKYMRPVDPGGQSGVTVGIGYDLKHHTPAQIRADWKGRVSSAMIEDMATVSGEDGTSYTKINKSVSIPWEAAISEFEDVELPRWEAKTARALPNTGMLSPDSFGALVSLTFNRGPSFSTKGERYNEMRAIRAAMQAEDFDQIPAHFRTMKRLWPAQAGLRKRRDTEAALFTKGLRAKPAPASIISRESTGDEDNRYAEPDTSIPLPPVRPAEAPAPITPPPVDAKVQGDEELWNVQRRLFAMNYKPGSLDGKWGGLTGGAISGFINDRHLEIPAPTSMEMFRDIQEPLKVGLSKAETQSPPFTRPIAVERAEATPEVVAKAAPEIVPVKQNKLTAIWAAITGFFAWIFKNVAEYFRESMEWLAGIKDFFADVPAEVWFALGIGSAIFMAWQAYRGENGISNAVKSGERL